MELEILNYQYWEYFKVCKDLRLTLRHGHPKIEKLEKELNEILERIQKIRTNQDNSIAL